jgi:hypothetical protein
LLGFVKVDPAVLGKSEKDLEADVSSMIEERLRLYNMNTNRRQDRQPCCGSGIWFFPSRIRIFPSQILDPNSASRDLSIFLTQKIAT